MPWLLDPGSGELYWPLSECDATTHLRVWKVKDHGHDEYHGALVYEGEYLHHIPPEDTIKGAQEILIRKLCLIAAEWTAADAENRLRLGLGPR